MIPKKTGLVFLLALLVLSLAGCGGLRYSQVSPEAKTFHPARVGVLPVDVGSYEEARGHVDQTVAGVLVDKKWFADVVSGDAIANQFTANKELQDVVVGYMAKLKTVNYSDPHQSKKLGELLQVDAVLMVNIDDWNYAVENGEKVAKVGMGMKLIDVATGKIVWKAGHAIMEKYRVFQPKLTDVAKDLVKEMIAYMPH